MDPRDPGTCALAVILWHRRHKHPDSWLVVVLCPIIAILGQVFAIYLLFKNIDTLAGTIGYVGPDRPDRHRSASSSGWSTRSC